VLYFRLFQTIEVDRTMGGSVMPRGDKSAYTDKQKRQAEHIEAGYEDRGVPDEEAERRAWATVNAMTGGGKKSGSGRSKKVNKAPARKGGRKGGKAAGKSRKSSKSSGKKAAKKSSKKGSSKR
jgi:plasmid stabilization system protein ParE